MRNTRNWLFAQALAGAAAALLGQLGVEAEQRRVDPAFLRRFVPNLAEKQVDVTTSTCRYKPIFGLGDADSALVEGIARYGEMTIEPGGSSAPTTCREEEQVYVVLEGSGVVSYGDQPCPVRKNDFMYLSPGVRRSVSNPSDRVCRLMAMGFRTPAGPPPTAPPKLLIANIDDVRKQVVGSHPPSVLYQLLIGDIRSTRDRIAAGRVLTSLFVMNFAPGGTNSPHHHEREEEIYLVLDGQGEMVAGGGADAIENRHPARAGDAYFFPRNCTAGFYSSTAADSKCRILAVRSLFPARRP